MRHAAFGRAGVVPPAVTNVTGWIQHSCKAPVTGAELYRKQDLFSIYVHRSIGVPPSPPDSIFAGRDIDDRCSTPRILPAQNCQTCPCMHRTAAGCASSHSRRDPLCRIAS